jgi:transcriptional regulator
MYIPRRYEQKDEAAILDFLQHHSFGILISIQDGKPAGTHIPFIVEKRGDKVVLGAHISKGYGQKTTLLNGAEVLVIFSGPHGYISPAWYTEMNVPTWNYISVHAYGTLQLIDDDALHQQLAALVNKYEAQQPSPKSVADIPQKMYADDFRGIIGFEITVTDLQAVYKLSQNRDEESFKGIITALEKKEDAAAYELAQAMLAARNTNPKS